MITLRLSDEAYQAVKQYAEAEQTSMNSWIEGLLDAEDMRRRCIAHDAWITANPRIVTAAAAFAEANQKALGEAGVPAVRG